MAIRVVTTGEAFLVFRNYTKLVMLLENKICGERENKHLLKLYF